MINDYGRIPPEFVEIVMFAEFEIAVSYKLFLQI
jgi:hypothetical protein